MRLQHRKGVRGILPMHAQFGHDILLSLDLLLDFPQPAPSDFNARAGTSSYRTFAFHHWHTILVKVDNSLSE